MGQQHPTCGAFGLPSCLGRPNALLRNLETHCEVEAACNQNCAAICENRMASMRPIRGRYKRKPAQLLAGVDLPIYAVEGDFITCTVAIEIIECAETTRNSSQQTMKPSLV